MFKKIFFALTLCTSSKLVLADEPGNNAAPPSSVVLTAPATSSLWTIGLEGQMMMPIDKFQFMQAALVNPDNPTTYHNESVDNEHDYGWEADIAYQFANTGRDVRVAYTDLNMSDTEHYAAPAGTTLYGINGRNNPLILTGGGNIYSTASYHYRAADLTTGQLLSVGQRVTLHPFAGLRYAKIDIDGNARYYANDNTENQFLSDSTFNGLGPRAGMDVNVHLFAGFSIVGTFGSSLLVGDMNENYHINTNTADSEQKNDETTAVIPELDESMGINYHYDLNKAMRGFDIQFGEQVVDYFNADQHDYLGTAYVNSSLNNEDFGYHGIYLRTQVAFA
ncbi:MAG: hypothetical protein K2Q14_01100 [Gammaproteobacteria bacterium]|nr:hypothetical protein [Gammaproteobacteria bacterium]